LVDYNIALKVFESDCTENHCGLFDWGEDAFALVLWLSKLYINEF
jgi:hypothetical protein